MNIFLTTPQTNVYLNIFYLFSSFRIVCTCGYIVIKLNAFPTHRVRNRHGFIYNFDYKVNKYTNK